MDSVLFLGTGASAGVPLIGCKCSVCTSPSAKNQRFRPSLLMRIQKKVLLVDIGPDFRSQALKFGIDSVDGLLLTHTHYDHIAGIDEVRLFNVRQKRAMPCLLSEESYEEIKRRYFYFFHAEDWSAKFLFSILPKEEGKIDFLEIPIQYCSFLQSQMKVNGFRYGSFAYISDIKEFQREKILFFLKGVKILVLSALRPDPSPFHLSFSEAALLAQEAGVETTWITHIGHFLDHEEINSSLPPSMQAAYDGLELEIEHA